MPAKTKVTAGQSAPANEAPLIGTAVPGATLGQVQGRGRRADPLPAALVTQLEGMRAGSVGAADASGSAAQVDKLKRQITRWVDEQNDADNPTDKGFRTLSKDSQNRQTGIRYHVFAVQASDSK